MLPFSSSSFPEKNVIPGAGPAIFWWWGAERELKAREITWSLALTTDEALKQFQKPNLTYMRKSPSE